MLRGVGRHCVARGSRGARTAAEQHTAQVGSNAPCAPGYQHRGDGGEMEECRVDVMETEPLR